MDRISDVNRFYSILEHLETRLHGKRELGSCDRRMVWPKRGVYFFFETGEQRSNGQPRVVRVGTHALTSNSRANLWQRLANHCGSRRGGGHHRGSIFRLLIGESLKGLGQFSEVLTWGKESGISAVARKLHMSNQEVKLLEAPLEFAVSQRIQAMPFLWLDVDDPPGSKSDRGVIERNSIALLSNYHQPVVDPASSGWLGRYCYHEKVRNSGLWNNRHVEESYDPSFFEVLERHVELTDSSGNV